MPSVLITTSVASSLLFRLELIERLIENGYRVIIICAKNAVIINKLIDIGCEYLELKVNRQGRNPLSDLSVLFQYIKIIKKVRPDIVLTYTVKPNIYASLACQFLRVRYINNITGLGVIGNKGIMQKGLFFLQRLAFQKSACVFFQNTENEKLYNDNRLVTSRAKIVPGSGVNINRFNAVAYPEEQSTIRFLVISRLRRDKGYDELFYAIRNITLCNLEFHIVGSIENDKYEYEINSLKENFSVWYYGTLAPEDVKNMIAECHCLIHPSHSEGMANVILESAASARPVIASDIPGCREAIDDGISGYLFSMRDATSLVGCIEQFTKLSWDQRKNMGVAGRRKMEREFDREVVVDAYIDEIQSCIGSR